MKFVSYLSLIIVILALTTCRNSDACPFLPETGPAVVKTNGEPLPYYAPAPDPSLFPRAVENPPVFDQGITVPLPSWGGFGQFLSLVLNAVLAFYLRRQTLMMSPPSK